MIRTIIIDDEPLAVESLSLILKKKCKDSVQVIASSHSPQHGRSLIEEHKPDLVFLDIEMPGMSGIDLVRSFSDPAFKVVFVTAFDAYAIEALRLSAIDYLLKPVEAEEIIRVIEKTITRAGKNDSSLGTKLENLEKILLKSSHTTEPRIGIAMAEKIIFINIGDIIYCEANGVYSTIYLHDGKKITASKPLGDFEAQLTQHRFFRIHHSFLINLDRIKEFQRYNGGYVVMLNNIKLEVSHRRRKAFLEAIDDLVV